MSRLSHAVRRLLGSPSDPTPPDPLAEHAPVGLALLADDLTPTRLNPAMRRLVGGGPALVSLLAGLDRDALLAGRLVATDKGPLHVRIAPAEGGFACVVVDAVGAADPDERLDELSRLTDDLTTFSEAVAHHLRQPLRTIDIFTQLVLDDAGDFLDGRARDYLARVRVAGRRMHAMIENLLRLSRISRVELTREEVDLSAMAQYVVRDLERRYLDHPVVVRVPPGITAFCDRNLALVAMEELLDNAWKFTVGRPEPTVTFTREAYEGLDVYVVRDNGVGLDPAQADHLFAEFRRSHEGREAPTRSGIGLASVQRVVRRHRGKLWVDGAPGEGAIFRFTLGPDDVVAAS